MAKVDKLRGRIRYEENFMNEGEYFIFEIKWDSEKEWGLETAYKCVDNKVNWEVIAHFKKWKQLGVIFEL